MHTYDNISDEAWDIIKKIGNYINSEQIEDCLNYIVSLSKDQFLSIGLMGIEVILEGITLTQKFVDDHKTFCDLFHKFVMDNYINNQQEIPSFRSAIRFDLLGILLNEK